MKNSTLGVIYVLIAGTLWGTMGVFVNYFSSIGLGSIETSGVRVFLLQFSYRSFSCFVTGHCFVLK